MLAEQIDVTMIVVSAFQALGVTYAIGGSFASAVHGVMRATLDADLIADLSLEHAEPLAQVLGGASYADVEMIRDAIRHHSSTSGPSSCGCSTTCARQRGSVREAVR